MGSAERMQLVAELIMQNKEQQLVVLSAMSGTTNTLLQISDYIRIGNQTGAADEVNSLERKYEKEIQALYHTSEKKEEV